MEPGTQHQIALSDIRGRFGGRDQIYPVDKSPYRVVLDAHQICCCSIRCYVPSTINDFIYLQPETKYGRRRRVTCSSPATCSDRNLPIGELRAKLTNSRARPRQTKSSALLSPSRMQGCDELKCIQWTAGIIRQWHIENTTPCGRCTMNTPCNQPTLLHVATITLTGGAAGAQKADVDVCPDRVA
jgi:hypothetical protein